MSEDNPDSPVIESNDEKNSAFKIVAGIIRCLFVFMFVSAGLFFGFIGILGFGFNHKPYSILDFVSPVLAVVCFWVSFKVLTAKGQTE